MGMFKRLKTFIKEVRLEFKNVTWPSKDELTGLTAAVLVVTAIFGIYIGLVDRLFAFLIRLFLS